MKSRNGAILLVEDNRDDVDLIVRTLKKGKVANKIDVVHDGEEALNYLFRKNEYSDRSPFETPSVVLLDLKMPKVGGVEVLREMRKSENTKYIPVVILTSSEEEEDLRTCYNLGCNSYVVKPVHFEDFKKAIYDLELYWLLLNESLDKDGKVDV